MPKPKHRNPIDFYKFIAAPCFGCETLRSAATNQLRSLELIREAFTGCIDYYLIEGHYDYDMAVVNAGMKWFSYLQGYFHEAEHELMDWWQLVFDENDLLFGIDKLGRFYPCCVLTDSTRDSVKREYTGGLKTLEEFIRGG